METVILVDDHDSPLGEMEKMEAHRLGKLHRAFSIFVFNSKGEMLIHQRALSKYHSGGLWTNACCSHPRPGEAVEAAAHRKLQQEMGFDCPLKWKFAFVYHVPLDKGLQEHEYDHVFLGTFNSVPKLNPEEAAAYKWIAPDALEKDVKARPAHYTEWFKIALERVLTFQKEHANSS